MDLDRYTVKSREALERLQRIARDRSHQELRPEHLLAALLAERERHRRRRAAEARRQRAPRSRSRWTQALESLPRVQGGQPTSARTCASVLDRAEDAPAAQMRRVRERRAPAHGARRSGARERRAACAGAGRRDARRAAQGARRVCAAASASPTTIPRTSTQALSKYGRDLTAAARAGQARPGDRPRRRDAPRRAGAVAAHQEQPGPDRRARRGQDRDRRSARAAHRLGRRAREPARTSA